MTGRQEDFYTMALAVADTCDRHLAAWQGLPAFVRAHDAFAGEMAALADAVAAQQGSLRGAAEAKDAARKTASDLAAAVAGALSAWAVEHDQAQVAARADLSWTDVYFVRDTVTLGRARLVWREATAHAADLAADYGVTPEILARLDEAIERYAGLIAQPRSAITGRKAATSAVARHLSAIRSVLRRRLDRLVPLLALSQPAFATAYRNARIVVNSGSKRKAAGQARGTRGPE